MTPHFSLLRLYVSTTIIAVGLAVMVRVVRVNGIAHWIVDFPVCFAGGMMLGAGALAPFKRMMLGAGIGLVLAALYVTAELLGW